MVAGRWVRSGLAALLIAVGTGSALADGYGGKSVKDAPAEAPKRDLQITGNVAGVTEYVFRGFSQSAENPTIQAGIDVTYKWFYAGMSVARDVSPVCSS
jgi:uncharacterized protein (TIGR02001 family)